MAAQYEMTDEEYAESFIAEHGIGMTWESIPGETGCNPLRLYTFRNRRGQVSIEMGCGMMGDPDDILRMFGTLATFCYAAADYDDAEAARKEFSDGMYDRLIGMTETLEAMTQTNIETISGTFCDF
jgi:hypothetical protein